MNAEFMAERLLARSFKAEFARRLFSVRTGVLALSLLGICLGLLLSLGSAHAAKDMLQVPAAATVKRPAGTDTIPERYLRRWDPEARAESLVGDAVAALWRPIVLTSLTDAFGFLAIAAFTEMPR